MGILITKGTLVQRIFTGIKEYFIMIMDQLMNVTDKDPECFCTCVTKLQDMKQKLIRLQGKVDKYTIIKDFIPTF